MVSFQVLGGLCVHCACLEAGCARAELVSLFPSAVCVFQSEGLSQHLVGSGGLCGCCRLAICSCVSVCCGLCMFLGVAVSMYLCVRKCVCL